MKPGPELFLQCVDMLESGFCWQDSGYLCHHSNKLSTTINKWCCRPVFRSKMSINPAVCWLLWLTVVSEFSSSTRHVELTCYLVLLQGDRVWLREDEQYLPSTVSSCSGGVVVFATDYGQVSSLSLKPLRPLQKTRTSFSLPVLFQPFQRRFL